MLSWCGGASRGSAGAPAACGVGVVPAGLLAGRIVCRVVSGGVGVVASAGGWVG